MNNYPSETLAYYSACGKVYVTIDYDEPSHLPIRINIELGKALSCAASNMEAISALATFCVKNNLHYSQGGSALSRDEMLAGLADCLEKHGCYKVASLTKSCHDVISHAMQPLIEQVKQEQVTT